MVSLASLTTLPANNLGRAIAGRQLLHIDLDELDRLWRALCSGAAGEKGDADHCCTGEHHRSFHTMSSRLVALTNQQSKLLESLLL